MQTKCFDTGKFTHRSNDEDQLVIQAFDVYPKPGKQTQFPALLRLFPYQTQLLLFAVALWRFGKKDGLAFLGVFWEFLC